MKKKKSGSGGGLMFIVLLLVFLWGANRVSAWFEDYQLGKARYESCYQDAHADAKILAIPLANRFYKTEEASWSLTTAGWILSVGTVLIAGIFSLIFRKPLSKLIRGLKERLLKKAELRVLRRFHAGIKNTAIPLIELKQIRRDFESTEEKRLESELALTAAELQNEEIQTSADLSNEFIQIRHNYEIQSLKFQTL